MGKSSKSSAPEYTSSIVNTGLFGSATADKNGVNYTPSAWETETSNAVTSNLAPTINSMNATYNSILNNDYLNDPNFQAYQNAVISSIHAIYCRSQITCYRI